MQIALVSIVEKEVQKYNKISTEIKSKISFVVIRN